MALWTTTQDEQLRRLYDEGYSCAQIAAQTPGKTRNAIIGRVHRLKLPLRGMGIHPPKDERQRKRRVTNPLGAKRKRRVTNPLGAKRIRKVAVIRPPREQIALRCAEVDPQHIKIEDLQPDHCRFPYGEGPYTFCGHQVFQGSYCGAHFFLSIGPGTNSEQQALKISRRKLEGAW